MELEVSMEYNDGYNETVYSFVNNINTKEGGTHLSGFKSGLTRVYNDFIKKLEYDKKEDSKLSGEDVREGLTAVLSLKIKQPQFEGQTKTKLGNSEAEGFVFSAVKDGLSEYFDQDIRLIKGSSRQSHPGFPGEGSGPASTGPHKAQRRSGIRCRSSWKTCRLF